MSNVRFAPVGLMDTVKQDNANNWSINPEQFADLASSLNNFFNRQNQTQHKTAGQLAA